MRLLIADDHALVRDALSAFLAREPDLQVETADSLPEAAARIETAGPFDLVLLDYEMPGMDGLAGLERALGLNAGRPVALMSGAASREIARQALDAGAAGFLPKTVAAASLVHAVRFMLAGEIYAPVAFMTAPEPEAAMHPLEEKLSERERQVLGGLCRGLSNKEIARELTLQEVTVKLHVKTLCRKLDARNRTQAAMVAKEAGIA
ncbi:response regulator transcription factor [Albimonas sp. CAU 1670]|uniref:response regulator transcription factor n=1 Tax=Albimonas sp. CAU 1670 TaxID=3032599 RepID=UPI0023DC08A5|nr:response regulator transcription factor [Albimonas sp. CAU 1670]MDF2232920.1 response regulator transcription factor [Albimonas sp. CAU 1670]